jgi:hypothetical protein
MAKTKSIIYGTILKLSKGYLEEVLSLFKKEIKGLKKFRHTIIKWKYNECAVFIYKIQNNY